MRLGDSPLASRSVSVLDYACSLAPCSKTGTHNRNCSDLTWTQTLWVDKMTCTHHLWTIPLVLYGSGQPLTFDSYKLNVAIVATHVLLSRWLTSESIMIASKDESKEQLVHARQDPSKYRYLNVNLSHSLWKDIKLRFVQISRDDPGCFLYIFRLLLRWQVFNLMTFVLVLRPLSHMMLSI